MLYRLVEVAVVQNDTPGGVWVGDCEFIVEYELEGGIPDEVALHLYAAVDGGVDDIPWWVEQDIDLFVDVDEDVVGGVFADGDRGGGGVDSAGTEQREVADLLDVQQTAAFGVADYFACD